MSGFKNCPSVTEFKVGMRVRLAGEAIWKTIMFIDVKGCVHCQNHDGTYVRLAFPIEQYELDLSQPWVGREYIKKSHPSAHAHVLMVDEDSVVSSFGWAFLSRGMFLDQFEPAPLPGPQPVQPGSVGPDMPKPKPTADDYLKGHKASGLKVGDRVKVLRKAEDYEGGWKFPWVSSMDRHVGQTITITFDGGTEGFASKDGCGFPYFVLQKVTEKPEAPCVGVAKWQPRINEPCGHRDSNGEICRVTPLGLNGSERVWFHREYDLLDDAGEIGWVEDLCPWPPEPQVVPAPPVKVGDILKVEFAKSRPTFGCVIEAPKSSVVVEYCHGCAMRVTLAEATITKLVPEVQP